MLRFGALYFAWVFALGAVLRTLRMRVLVLALGAPLAVLLELPLMLGFAGWLCGCLFKPRRCSGRQALALGAFAFALLMLAELALSTLLAQRSLAEHLALYRSPAGALGLFGQVLLALLPRCRVRGFGEPVATGS